ncbi:ComF family protein [Crenothrix sp.]|uniref:ComF family protein n=1 Tax=Crenothrix sp. TaxID=3100433 RepID=UPI00374D9A09
MKKVYNWLSIIQNALLPPTCILCGNKGFGSLDICETCYQRLPRNNACCYRCAEIFVTAIAVPTLCGRCLSETPSFDETHAPFIHQEEIRHLITGLKFGAQFKNARLLGSLLADHVGKAAERPDCIIPVPLHKARYHERGFNQALEIARTVSLTLHIPLDFYSCTRHKDTPHQTGLSAKKRRQNLRRAFSVQKPIPANHVVILDDVMTTGSTANALAVELKKSGVNRVDIWVCARA